MKSGLLRHRITIIGIAALAFLAIASGASTPKPAANTAGGSEQVVSAQQSSDGQAAPPVQAVPAQASGASPYYTGNGGKGMRLGILVPHGQRLDENQGYLPAMIQGVLVSNMSKYSAISVLDRVSLDRVIMETLDLTYEDDLDVVRVGHIAQVGHMLTGTIIKTSTGFSLQLTVTDTAAQAKTVASYSGTCTAAELDNHSAIHRASLELLSQMNVALTARARNELGRASAPEDVSAQTALAQGVTAQRQGAELEALSYFIKAVHYDEGLEEAESRLNTLTASITSGSAGADARNDIALRRQWIQRLQDTEDFFTAYTGASQPYYLVYETDIKHGTINYQNETVDLSFWMSLYPDATCASTINQVITTVGNGLVATGRTQDWGLDWPARSLSTPSPFMNRTNNLAVVVEILNDKGRSIGKHTASIPAGFTIYSLMSANVSARPWEGEVTVPAVDVNSITDKLTIRISSIDGIPAENAARQKRVSIMSADEYFRMFRIRRVTAELSLFQVRNDGTLTGYTGNEVNVVIPHIVNGIYITAIGDNAFRGKGLSSVTIPNTVRSIGASAFNGNRISRVTLPDSVRTIGDGAFGNDPSLITIGSGVDLGWWAAQPFRGRAFFDLYNGNGRRAGTYRLENNTYVYSSR